VMQRLRRQVNTGFAVGAALLLLTSGVAVWSSLRSRDAAEERRALFERRTRIEHLLGALQDAETGQRGYLLTGDSTFLGPYLNVAGSFPTRLEGIRSGFVTHQDRMPRLDTLSSLVNQKLNEMAQTLSLARSGRNAEAQRLVRAGEGKQYMDQIRALVLSLVQDEQTLLKAWDDRLLAADRLSMSTSVASLILAALLLAVGAATVNRSMTAREEADAARAEGEQRLFRLLEALPVAVFVLDAKGNPFYANRVSQEILGKGIVPDTSTTDLPRVYPTYVAGTDQPYPPDRLPIVRALTGEKVYAEDLELRQDDRIVPLEVWAAPVHDSAGKVAFAVAVFSDIHERKAARESIRKLNEELTGKVSELIDLNQELEAFTYSVSHDLRAPVRHIDGFSRLLQENLGDKLDAESRRYLERIRAGAANMGTLIDDLLQLSRVGRQELIVQRTDLNAVLRSVIYDLRDDVKDRNIDWRTGKLHSTECDQRLIRQVFVNLITNALKFSRGRTPAVIEVGEKSMNGEPAIYVRDNGVGFDMKYADKLFGVFQRLHQAEEFEGTGVGLAIVHRIVRKHGGRVWAEAEPDKGATFYFTLDGAGRARHGTGKK